MCREVELYKLVTGSEDRVCCPTEVHWWGDDELLLWVPYYCIEDFFKKMKEIFGRDFLDDGGVEAKLQCDGICFDLVEALCGYDIVLEDIFPKDKFN